MSAKDLKALAALTRKSWKSLALADQSDADEMVGILKNLLEGLDAIEEKASESIDPEA
jgi:hypothetical protein